MGVQIESEIAGQGSEAAQRDSAAARFGGERLDRGPIPREQDDSIRIRKAVRKIRAVDRGVLKRQLAAGLGVGDRAPNCSCHFDGAGGDEVAIEAVEDAKIHTGIHGEVEGLCRYLYRATGLDVGLRSSEMEAIQPDRAAVQSRRYRFRVLDGDRLPGGAWQSLNGEPGQLHRSAQLIGVQNRSVYG